MARIPAPPRRPRRSERIRGAVVSAGIGAALALAACSTAERADPPELPSGVELVDPDDDLYALAHEVAPGRPGEPIAVQQVDSELDGEVWRVLHRSESLTGEPIAVSGLLIVPAGPVPAGGRTVVSWGHGTTGLGDRCAPSRTFTHLAAALPILEEGAVIAATDYEGLGTPGPHPYLVGESQGRGVLDVARAAQAMPGITGAGEQVVLWGHSQGGHAVLFANEIAESWAPELDVVGTVAVAPPSQMASFLAGVVDRPSSFLIAMVVAAWSDAYPDVDPAEALTPLGLERIATAGDSCVDEVARVWGAPADGPLVGAFSPRWGELLVDNDPGHRAGTSPVLLLHGDQDDVIPAAASAALVERMCAQGQPVRHLALPDSDHTSVVVDAYPAMLDWIEGRLAGEPVPDDCDP